MITKKTYPAHTKTEVISARVPKPLIKKIDKLCSDTGRTRSDVINQILDFYFSEYLTLEPVDDFNFDTIE